MSESFQRYVFFVFLGIDIYVLHRVIKLCLILMIFLKSILARVRGFSTHPEGGDWRGCAEYRYISYIGWVQVLVRTKTFMRGGLPADLWSGIMVLTIHANISIFVRIGSSSTSKSLKSPYDPESVCLTENPINRNKQVIES